MPWAYEERPLVGTLAAATWLAGGRAFEEYGDIKRTRYKTKVGFKGAYHGRVDLLIETRAGDFLVEAKRCWSGASGMNARPPIRIEKCLEDACRCARNNRAQGKYRRLGILFAVPYISKLRSHDVDHCIMNWIKSVKKVQCSCRAWVFPKEERIGWANETCPGVAILVREVKK